jgi:hypothetical protein
VYAVGHDLVPREGHWLAAVLASQPDAVLSHRTAASLWSLVREDRRPIDVMSPRKTGPTGSIRRHCSKLEPNEIAVLRRIPVTSLPRTLVDFASVASEEALEAAIRESEYLHDLSPERLCEFVEHRRGRRGVAKLRVCLLRLIDGPRGRTRSRLEVKFAALLSRTDLPRPFLNVVLDLDGGKIEADCLWRPQRLIVELDGGREHGTRSAQASDRRRDRRLRAAGWRLMRVSSSTLEEPEALIADLRRRLAQSASTGE